MARQESDHEDLLREATALVERAELAIEGFAEPVVVGFRRNGCASFYFGSDPAYHFNTAGELRRALVEGKIYKAERGRLVSLERRRTDRSVELFRCELTDAEMSEFMREMLRRLNALACGIRIGRYRCVGEVSDNGMIAVLGLQWIDGIAIPPPIAQSPHAK